MIDATLPAKIVKEMVNVIKDLTMDVNIHFDTGKIEMSGIDPEHVCVVYWCIRNDKITADHSVYGMYMNSLYKFLRSAEKDDNLVIKSEDKGLKFSITSPNKQIEFTFYNIIIPVEPIVQLNRDNTDGQVFIKTSVLQKALRDISHNSKIVKLEVDTLGSISFITKGDSGIGGILFSYDSPDIVWCYRHFDSYKKSFYIQYFDKFVKSSVTEFISFKFDSLLYMEYIHDCEEGVHNLTIGLSPFIDSLV